MKDWIRKRSSIAEMTPKSQSLAIKYFLLSSTQTAQAVIASTFLVLFLLEVISFAELSLLLAIRFGLILLLDYPTGALGDTIGHKIVLAFAYVSYALSILCLLTGNSFVELIPFTILTAIGRSQESGVLQSWFDNNYRSTIETLDDDRKIYGEFIGKMRANSGLISGMLFIVGGVIAVVFSRKVLFTIQLYLVLIALLFIILLMTREEGAGTSHRTLRTYIDRFIGGLQFAVSSQGILLYFLGFTIIFAAFGSIWYEMMLMPLYRSYSGSDEYTGLLRAIIYGTLVFWQLVVAQISKKVEKPYRSLFLSNFVLSIIFFVLLFIFYKLFSPPNTFMWSYYVGVILLFQIISICDSFDSIFRQRLLIELVPDKYRTAVYSLIPTLIVLFSIPLIILAGFIITDYGFAAGILLMLCIGLVGVPIFGLGLYKLSKPRINDLKVLSQDA